MIFLVSSVHHTGTKTIFNDVLGGYEIVKQQNYEHSGPGRIRIHIDKPFLEDIEYWMAGSNQ